MSDLSAYVALVVETVKAIAWPLTVSILILTISSRFREPLSRLIDRSKKTTLKFGSINIVLEHDEVDKILQQLLDETLQSTKNLTEEQKRLFKIVQSAAGSKDVNEINRLAFNRDFVKNGVDHKCFRELRDRKLVRPQEGSSWQADKHPVVTRFADLILRIQPKAFD